MPNDADVPYSSVDDRRRRASATARTTSAARARTRRSSPRPSCATRTSAQPSRSSVSTVVRTTVSPRSRGRTRASRNAARDEERRRVERERRSPRRARARARSPAPGRRTRRAVSKRADVALACWISLLGHGLRHQPVVGRAEERLGGAEQRLDHDELPDLDAAGEDQRRQQRVQREAHEVGHDHHAVARQAVGPHAAEQEEADQRQRVRREHEPEVGRRAGESVTNSASATNTMRSPSVLAAWPNNRQSEVAVGEHSLHDTASWPRWTSTSSSMPGSAHGRAATPLGSNPCAWNRSPTRTR